MAAMAVLLGAASTQEVHSQSRSSADVNDVRRRANAGDADALNQLGVWHYSGQHVAKNYDKAIELWRSAALQGNPKAIANLGICYQYGTGVLRDSITAMRLYASAIDGGQESLLRQRMANVGKSTFDGMLVGLCYEKGIGVERDNIQAANAYSTSADLGSADGAAAASRCLLATGDAPRAYRYALRAAEAGNSEGIALAGLMLVDGKGVTPSTRKGVEYLLRAAPHNIDAVNRLATLMFANTQEVSSHTSRIASLLVSAARQGNQQAMLNYARALRDGTGMSRDFDRALHWLTLVKENGDDAAITRFITMSPENFRNYYRAYTLAAEGKFKDADKILKDLERKNITEASVMRAAILANTDNPDSNTASAIKQLSKLAGKSDQAATLLAKLQLGDNKGSLALLERAANHGYGPAAAVLASIYRTGDGTTRDIPRAASFARQAYAERDISTEEMKLY